MKLQDLKKFEQFSRLNDEQLILLSKHLRLYRSQQANEVILKQGSTNPHEFFLLEGELELSTEDGQPHILKADTENARFSVARLRPSYYTVTTRTPCQLIVVDASLLREFVRSAPDVRDAERKPSDCTQDLLSRFQQDLQAEAFTLPSLPKVALKVRELINSDNYTIEDLTQILQTDQAIVTKLIKAANSPLYRALQPCANCKDAVLRLGVDTTKQLVISFAIKQLFKAHNEVIKRFMLRTWETSVTVGALSRVLAQTVSELDSELAMLIGLLHNIGELPILMYLDQQDNVQEEHLQTQLQELRLPMAQQLLEYWRFDTEIIQAIKHGETWYHQSDSEQGSYADILIIAKLHSFIGQPDQYRYPRIDEVPAYQKLELGGLTPSLSLTIIEESLSQLETTRDLFRL